MCVCVCVLVGCHAVAFAARRAPTHGCLGSKTRVQVTHTNRNHLPAHDPHAPLARLAAHEQLAAPVAPIAVAARLRRRPRSARVHRRAVRQRRLHACVTQRRWQWKSQPHTQQHQQSLYWPHARSQRDRVAWEWQWVFWCGVGAWRGSRGACGRGRSGPQWGDQGCGCGADTEACAACTEHIVLGTVVYRTIQPGEALFHAPSLHPRCLLRPCLCACSLRALHAEQSSACDSNSVRVRVPCALCRQFYTTGSSTAQGVSPSSPTA